MELDTYIEVMVEAGRRLGLSADVRDGGWVIRFVDASGEEYDVIWFDVGLNSSLSRRKVSDKAMCYKILDDAGIPSVEHWFVMSPGKGIYNVGGVYETLYRMFEESESGLVLKPNDGGAGKNVMLVRSLVELDAVATDLFANGISVAVSPYYHYDVEYRVVVLDGEVMMSFGKRKPEGDFKHNLSSGSSVEMVPRDIEDELVKLAIDAAEALDSRFCTVDVIDHPELGLKVMEVNNTVTLKRVAAAGDDWKELSVLSYEKALSKVIETRRVHHEILKRQKTTC